MLINTFSLQRNIFYYSGITNEFNNKKNEFFKIIDKPDRLWYTHNTGIL